VQAPSPLDEYFDAIDSGDVERTTAAFTEDALYIRPNLEVAGALVVARGHAELRDYLTERGKRPFRHVIRGFAVDGLDCFAEGVAVEETGDRNPIASFLVRARFAEDGRIAEYFALMSGVREGAEGA
jgi:ketosteroid isomerase-like protein